MTAIFYNTKCKSCRLFVKGARKPETVESICTLPAEPTTEHPNGGKVVMDAPACANFRP